MTSSPEPGVLISQPVHQHAYEAAIAAQEAGLLRYFVTGLYYTGRGLTNRRLRGWMLGPWESRIERELRRRWHPELSIDHVVTFPYHHLIALTWRKTFGRLLELPGVNMDTWAHERFDEVVGARLGSFEDVRVVHAFEGSAEATLQSAKRIGMATILDVTSAQEDLLRTGARNGRAPSDNLSARIRSERERADYLLAPSDHVMRCLLEHGVPAERIVKVPYGVDTERFRPVERPAEPKTFRAFFAGKIGNSKGVHHLLEAWQRLSLPGAELVLAGSLERTGRDILRRYPGTWRWVGSIPKQEIHHLFAASDVFVLPSLSESWGLVISEAMATGLPVVATSACGATMRHGQDGLVVPPADIEALCDALQFLYDHPDERHRMGTSARQFVEDHYTWRHYRLRLSVLYQAIVAGRPAGWADLPLAPGGSANA
jgi:glycosyltransferase involved in cell wall biosynthesis